MRAGRFDAGSYATGIPGRAIKHRWKYQLSLRRLFLWVVPLLVSGLLFSSPANAQSQRFHVLITEIFPDPSPGSLLPNAEFIELKNVTANDIDLQGWKITDGTSTATIRTPVVLYADSFIIISTVSAASAYRALGTCIGITAFPSLNNEKDRITLLSPTNETIHSVSYSIDWFGNEIKKMGGWTLEMIDPSAPCMGSGNWKASVHPSGGTPGYINSVHGSNADLQAPALLRTYMPDSMTLVAVFDESLDTLTAINKRNFELTGTNAAITAIELKGPDFTEIRMSLSSPVSPQEPGLLTISRIADCSGNLIGSINTAPFGFASSPAEGDIIINELLFNPASGGSDYIELYNRSKRTIDLSKIFVVGRSATGAYSDPVAASSGFHFLFPGEYLVLTEDKTWLKQAFVVKNERMVVEITDLPSLPDDKGFIALMNSQGVVIDELAYSDKFHFALINNKEGVALERIDYSKPGNIGSNWTSASSGAGYGTPGYQNSQFRADLVASGMFEVVAPAFSPDNDGFNDIAGFTYALPEAGYMGSLVLYDASGRPVRYLVKSALLGIKGIFNWDGLDEQLRKLPAGPYIAMMEIFNLQGKTQRFKRVITLARRW